MSTRTPLSHFDSPTQSRSIRKTTQFGPYRQTGCPHDDEHKFLQVGSKINLDKTNDEFPGLCVLIIAFDSVDESIALLCVDDLEFGLEFLDGTSDSKPASWKRMSAKG